jgi:hypothetical protein
MGVTGMRFFLLPDGSGFGRGFEFEFDHHFVANQVVGLSGVNDTEVLAVDVELRVDLRLVTSEAGRRGEGDVFAVARSDLVSRLPGRARFRLQTGRRWVPMCP